MNRIYRLVFNRALGVMQVASEVAQNPGGNAGAAVRLPRLRMHQLAVALAATLASGSAFAACNTVGTTVTCATGSNTNSLANSLNGVTLDIQTGAQLSVLPIVGGSAVALNGDGITVNNQGTVDPTINGGLSLAASGMVLGNATVGGNAINVNNQAGGSINGVVNVLSLLGFGGQALVLQNASGGTNTVVNNGTVGMSIFGAGAFTTADAPAIVSYGGAQTHFTNTGTITGRVGFGGSASATNGNTFLNAGTLNGSVNLGNSTAGNIFTAVSGSSVNNAGIAIAGVLGSVNVNLAAAGVVDGGSASNNSLVLQNSASGPGAGTGGAVTSLDWSRHVNFQNLTVNSGTWNLLGGWGGASATINDGLVNFNNAASFGTGIFYVNGGAIAASTAGLTLANPFALNTGRLTLGGTNAFGLSGVLSGAGGLTVNNTGVVTLGGANLFSGGVNLNAGGLLLGNAGALGSGNLTVGGSASLDTSGAFNLANNIVVNSGGNLNLLGSNAVTLNGSLSGAGNFIKSGAGTLTLGGANLLTGGFSITGGRWRSVRVAVCRPPVR